MVTETYITIKTPLKTFGNKDTPVKKLGCFKEKRYKEA